jgi:hypothetical protein
MSNMLSRRMTLIEIVTEGLKVLEAVTYGRQSFSPALFGLGIAAASFLAFSAQDG